MEPEIKVVNAQPAQRDLHDRPIPYVGLDMDAHRFLFFQQSFPVTQTAREHSFSA